VGGGIFAQFFIGKIELRLVNRRAAYAIVSISPGQMATSGGKSGAAAA